MKYYLSSYKLGNQQKRLQSLVSDNQNKKFGYIPNARDSSGLDSQKNKEWIEEDIFDLKSQGFDVEIIDLKNYFAKEEELEKKVNSLGGVYVSGGNTFILRQAMKLSGFDKFLINSQNKNNFLYIAYSAGVCVLTPSLKPYAITDDAKKFPYSEIQEQIWDGLGIIDFIFQPHYKSDHPESESTDKEIEYCIENKLLFKAYQDGEVLILE